MMLVNMLEMRDMYAWIWVWVRMRTHIVRSGVRVRICVHVRVCVLACECMIRCKIITMTRGVFVRYVVALSR